MFVTFVTRQSRNKPKQKVAERKASQAQEVAVPKA